MSLKHSQMDFVVNKRPTHQQTTPVFRVKMVMAESSLDTAKVVWTWFSILKLRSSRSPDRVKKQRRCLHASIFLSFTP